MERGSTQLARALRDIIGHAEHLAALLIQEQVVVAEMLSAHVPVEVLRFQVKREDVRQHLAKGIGYLDDGIAAEVGWSCREVFHLSRGVAFHCFVLPLQKSSLNSHLLRILIAFTGQRDIRRCASASASRPPKSASA